MSDHDVWTAEEISSRIGISTAVFPRGTDLDERQIAQVRAVGIFRAGGSVLDLDLSVKVPPIGYIEVGSVTLHRQPEAELTSVDMASSAD